MSEQSQHEAYKLVRVLYDFNYTDTDSEEEIYMYVDEEFILLHETNEEWWEVCRQKENVPFFVPAQYVTILDTKTDLNCNTEEIREVTAEEEGDDGQDYVNLEEIELQKQKQSTSACKGQEQPEVTYQNLQEFRAASNIPEPNAAEKPQSAPPAPPSSLSIEDKESPSGEYANLAFIQSSIHPPAPEQGDFVQVLLEPLPWDVYKDRYSGRLFYHNRDTNECMWKPPRKSKSPSSPPPEKFDDHLQDTRLPSKAKSRPALSAGFFEEYDKTVEHGVEYFTHKTSKEKYKKVSDEERKEIFYVNVEKGEKYKELPSKLTERRLSGKDAEPTNGEVAGTVTNKSYTSLPRSSKSVSLYGNNEFKQNLEEHLSKSSTLPPNFAPPAGQPGGQPTPLTVPPPVTPPAITFNDVVHATPPPPHGMVRSTTSPDATTIAQTYRSEPLSGYIMTSKLSEVGKKVKKNWGQAYLMLKQTNLVFYKDEKATKTGSPYGKPELIVNLPGAKIDINPKDITSKKNVILLVATNGSRYLLQSDEGTILRWFTEMKLVSGDLEAESSRSSVKEKGMTRSFSAEDGSGGRKLWDIRSRLLNLMRSRPAQEDLVKRGIIKDLVFGSRLKDLCDKEHTKVPRFVRACITAVETRGLDHDGIYRISGNLAEIQKLRYAVDKDENYNLDDKQWDMNVLTGSLKLFFRELKEPLVPPDMFDRFSAAVCKESYKERLKAVKELMPDVPRCNYETMKCLFSHLVLVIKESKKNRMQAHNLAIVFGPTLSWKEEADVSNMAVLTVYQSRIVEFMLMEFEHLFK